MPIRDVIQQLLLEPEFQAIVAVNEGRIAGYEALIRGPAQFALREPRSLFAAAEQAGLVRELERACLTAIAREVSRRIDRIPRWARVFLNVLPEDILDPAFFTHVAVELEKNRIDPARLVIEITESTRIEDYQAFNLCLHRFRELGFGVAVDDAGAGHAGLQMIAEINPDYLKIDQSLVRGIDRSIAKRAGVEALIGLARSLGMTVIAEGIENEDELHALFELGIALGQGYLLSHPSREMAPGISATPHQLRISHWASLDLEVHGRSSGIGEVALPAPTVSPSTRLETLTGIFESRRDTDAVVVVHKGEPTGLVMRARLQQDLSRPYAAEAMHTLLVANVMSEHPPLIVDCEMQLDAAAQLAMSRGCGEVYDHIIVVRDGKLAGTVSVRRLLQAITDARIRGASHAHPLTGLPGHPVMEEWVRTALRDHGNVALLHFDIDSLRSFNELYGFRLGDRAIRMAAELLSNELSAQGGDAARLAHVGGDDFLALVAPAVAEQLAARLPPLFRERAAQLYQAEDRARGFIVTQGLSGERLRVPLLSMTVAAIHPVAGRHEHYAELLDLLADARCAASARSESASLEEMRLASPQILMDGTQLASRTSHNAA